MFTKEQLLKRYPNAQDKEINAAIKYHEKFSLTLDNLRCLNPECNNIRKWNNNKDGFNYTCNDIVCKLKTKEDINKLKNKKSKQTYLSKTGFINPSQNPEVKQKKKETCKKKTGYDNPNQDPKIKQQKKETCLLKYGCDNPSKSKEIIEKIKKTNINNFGTTSFTNTHKININNWDNKQFWVDNFLTEDNNFDKFKAIEYFNINFSNIYRQLKELNIEYIKFKGTSLKEQALIPILNKLNIHNIVTNSRTIIPPLELDIYLPDHNLAIEYNGAYWHQDSMKPADYHQSKSIACLSKGIRLLHIFEGYNDYNLEETLKEFLNYKADKETGVFDLSTGCYPLVSNYKIQEPELINIMGFNIYDAGKIHLKE